MYYFMLWTYVVLSRSLSFHDSEYEDGCILGCSDVQSGRSLPVFQRSIIRARMEAASTSDGELLPGYMML